MTTVTQAPARLIQGAVLENSGADRPYAQSQPIVVSELELAGPEDNELLVRITAAGVCHSDLSVVNNDRPRPVPMLLGHEATGIVELVGPGVNDIAVGDTVVMTFLPRCGNCQGCRSEGKIPCENGSRANEAGTLLGGGRRLRRNGEKVQHHIGVSGFATHAVVSRNSVVPIGSDVPPEVAAIFGCAILTGGGAVLNVAKPASDDTIAVIGLGGVGMAAVITAAALGVKEIVGIDLQESKRDMALELGASSVMSPIEAEASGKRFAAVIEAAGHPKALETAWAITEPGGMTCTVGLPAPGQKIEIDPLQITSQARHLVGSYLGSAVPSVDIPIYEALWREGKLNAEGLISSRIELTDINEAMDQLEQGNVLRQIIVFPTPSDEEDKE
ncbi:alcohol dehydrogenase catalytic domain-containing protein [Corynebacterium halotolerans]|uniref:Alcohol dehydrogenase n=1 Tax=Corynebacterium halotolerans YIM 70093 = DSM 44683 TaxID=1121362 RepID=M1NUC2_9CORY|nr:alcohol dehydrogenase catalytic domain-containing protein [Corynebacterium halotolerans]AGF71105.1 alcohol dehydrogenase [Corynebacterium halotolerans YIM 70093 = DSM 44683]